jgi:hypothetical protein
VTAYGEADHGVDLGSGGRGRAAFLLDQ